MVARACLDKFIRFNEVHYYFDKPDHFRFDPKLLQPLGENRNLTEACSSKTLKERQPFWPLDFSLLA